MVIRFGSPSDDPALSCCAQCAASCASSSQLDRSYWHLLRIAVVASATLSPHLTRTRDRPLTVCRQHLAHWSPSEKKKKSVCPFVHIFATAKVSGGWRCSWGFPFRYDAVVVAFLSFFFIFKRAGVVVPARSFLLEKKRNETVPKERLYSKSLRNGSDVDRQRRLS